MLLLLQRARRSVCVLSVVCLTGFIMLLYVGINEQHCMCVIPIFRTAATAWRGHIMARNGAAGKKIRIAKAFCDSLSRSA